MHASGNLGIVTVPYAGAGFGGGNLRQARRIPDSGLEDHKNDAHKYSGKEIVIGQGTQGDSHEDSLRLKCSVGQHDTYRPDQECQTDENVAGPEDAVSFIDQ